ncbi:hypothetical protein ACFV09_41940 [Streptomyces sp. NPDC059631]|uniref:hypothetical protein n=1 Tax=Streptomyces sp. NPDC059631 TaxID=3346890 RepID=UPI0036A61E34
METGDQKTTSAPSITQDTLAPAAFSTRPDEAPPNNLAGTKRSFSERLILFSGGLECFWAATDGHRAGDLSVKRLMRQLVDQ